MAISYESEMHAERLLVGDVCGGGGVICRHYDQIEPRVVSATTPPMSHRNWVDKSRTARQPPAHINFIIKNRYHECCTSTHSNKGVLHQLLTMHNDIVSRLFLAIGLIIWRRR